MKTDDLLKVLSQDPAAGPSGQRLLALLLPLTIMFALGVVVFGLGLRFPLEKTLFWPMIAPKFYIPLVLGLGGLVLAMRLGRPVARARLGWLVLAPVAGAAMLVLAWLATPEGARQMAFTGKTILPCLVTIPLLSLPVLGAVLVALRRDAVLAPVRAGVVAWLAAGGIGAAIYALHCTEDSALFYVTWYGLGILICGAAGGIVGAKALRW